MIGTARLDSLQACIDDVLRSNVPGDLVETGVWRGGASIFMRGVLKARGHEDRLVWACDSFEGFPKANPALRPDAEGAPWHTVRPLRISLDEVRANFERYGLLDDNVRFAKGWFKDTLPELADRTWAVIRLDGDMYESTMDALTYLYPRLSPGGYLIVDDFVLDVCRQAIHDYRAKHQIQEPIQQIDWSSVMWQKAPTESSGGAHLTRAQAREAAR